MIRFSIVFFILISSQVWAKDVRTCMAYSLSKKYVDEALNCQTDNAEFSKLINHMDGVTTLVTKMNLYPVYSSEGIFLKFIKWNGEFEKGLVLVAKSEKEIQDSYTSLEGFAIYRSNHYRADLSCFVDHRKAGIPTEKQVSDCIDEKISYALKKHEMTKIRRFDIKKMWMILEESSGAFDTHSSCSGSQTLTFFAGKVYNTNDFGNFIWGAILERLKVTDFTKKAGSTLNGYIASGRQNESFFKSTSILGDEPHDQIAIFDGARWVRRNSKKVEP